MMACAVPVSPTARLAALMREFRVSSETIRPSQTVSISSCLADDVASVLDQIGKQAEHLRFDRHPTLRAPEFEKLGVQGEGAEAVDHGAQPPDAQITRL